MLYPSAQLAVQPVRRPLSGKESSKRLLEKMSEKKFSKQHEWISVEGDIATVGITKHAAEMLGDVVFVELMFCSYVVLVFC